MSANNASHTKLLTFRLAGELFGMDIGRIKEINRNCYATPVPSAPPKIVGLYNMRGQTVLLLDLGYMMGYGGNVREDNLTTLILKSRATDAFLYGFVVDSVEDVLTLENSLAQPPPANLMSSEHRWLKRVFQLKNELLLEIEPDKLD